MCEVDYLHLGLSLPALRGRQGGRAMYVALPSNNVINTFFPTHLEGSPPTPSGHLDGDRVEAIASYIQDTSDGFVLGPIAYATDSECKFEEVMPGAQFGVLRLPLNAKLRSLDGFHRREALRTVVERLNGVGNQHTALLLYVEPRLDRRRAMFADLNRPTAHPAAPSVPASRSITGVASEDPFAVVADALTRTHPFLKGRVEASPHQGRRRERDFDTKSVVDFLKRLTVGPTGRVKEPQRYDPEVIFEQATTVLQALAEVASGGTGGHDALSWRSMLRVVGGAIWVLTQEGGEYRLGLDAIARALRSIDYSADGVVWQDPGIRDDLGTTGRTNQASILKAVDLMVSGIVSRQGQPDDPEPPATRPDQTDSTTVVGLDSLVGTTSGSRVRS